MAIILAEQVCLLFALIMNLWWLHQSMVDILLGNLASLVKLVCFDAKWLVCLAAWVLGFLVARILNAWWLSLEDSFLGGWLSWWLASLVDSWLGGWLTLANPG
jgi:hypothetical protein